MPLMLAKPVGLPIDIRINDQHFKVYPKAQCQNAHAGPDVNGLL